MTDKERLEEIKEWFNNDEEIHQFQIEWLIEQAEKAEKQHFEILALEANLKGNDKIIEEQEKEIDEHCETKGLLGRQVFALTQRVDELTSENEHLKKYKKTLMENSVVRSDYIKKLEEELIQAYLTRGTMFFAGEREWIDNRIKELEGE